MDPLDLYTVREYMSLPLQYYGIRVGFCTPSGHWVCDSLYSDAALSANGCPARSFELSNGEHTCPPGLGYSFAGGTTDGPGDAPFFQGYDKKNIPGANSTPC